MRTIGCANIILIMGALLAMSVLGLPQGAVSCEASTGLADSRLSGYELFAENDQLQLWFSHASAEIAVLDKEADYIWYSNPPARAQQEKIAKGALKEAVGSQISLVCYTPRDQRLSFESYNDSVKYGQFEVTEITDGLRVDYTVGQEWSDQDYLPIMISYDEFHRLVLGSVDESDQSLFLRCYDLVQLVEVDDNHPQVEVYQLDPGVLKGYTFVSPGVELTQRAHKSMVDNFVDQLVNGRADLNGRPDIRRDDISQALRDTPAYVLKSSIRAWDKTGMIDILKKTGLSPTELRGDHEKYGLDAPTPNPVVFHVAVEYVLEGDSLVVRIPVDSISYPTDAPYVGGKRGAYPLTSIDLLKYFGAAGLDEQGYMLVPDGSGGLIDFNNGRLFAPAYQSSVYGRDNSLDESTELLAEAEQIYLPVFGMKRGSNGFICIIEEGQPLARIRADVAGRVDSYNKVYPAFTVVPQGTSALKGVPQWRSGVTGGNQQINIYQPRKPDSDFQVRYAFLSGDDADYSGMARRYQQYLEDRAVLRPLEADDDGLPFFLELVGAIGVTKPVLGVAREVMEPITTYSQAATIVETFLNHGVPNIELVYTGWMSGGVNHRFPKGVSLEASLGTKEDFRRLRDFLKARGVEFYPMVSLMGVYRDTWFDGFSLMSMAARRLNRSSSQIVSYDAVTGAPLTAPASSPYVLSARQLPGVVDSFIRDYAKYGISGLSLRFMGAHVDSDFRGRGDQLVDRCQALDIVEGQLQRLAGDFELSVLVDGANDYALRYAKHVINAPVGSSGHNIVNRTIPFYQMVVHGYIDYAGQPINHSESPRLSMLRAIETGASPYFQLGGSDPSKTKDTNFADLYSMDYEAWLQVAVRFYQEANEVLGDVRHERIVRHAELCDGVFETVYESGKSVVVNYGSEDVAVRGYRVPALGYIAFAGEVWDEAN